MSNTKAPYYGHKFTANDANDMTNNISDKVLRVRWNLIMGIIKLVSLEGKHFADMPFQLRHIEITRLEGIGYYINDNAITWDIDLFTEDDLKDAFQ